MKHQDQTISSSAKNRTRNTDCNRNRGHLNGPVIIYYNEFLYDMRTLTWAIRSRGTRDPHNRSPPISGKITTRCKTLFVHHDPNRRRDKAAAISTVSVLYQQKTGPHTTVGTGLKHHITVTDRQLRASPHLTRGSIRTPLTISPTCSVHIYN